MSIQQIGELLQWSVAYHQNLAQQYDNLSAETDQSRMKMLLGYLADHEREIERGLSRHLEENDASLDGQWLCGGADYYPPQRLQENKDALCCESLEQVADQAVAIHEQLQTMYSELGQQNRLEHGRDLLNALAAYEEAETRRLVRDVGRFEMC